MNKKLKASKEQCERNKKRFYECYKGWHGMAFRERKSYHTASLSLVSYEANKVKFKTLKDATLLITKLRLYAQKIVKFQ